MMPFCIPSFASFLILYVTILYCNGTKVQFFKEPGFEGSLEFEVNHTRSCTPTPGPLTGSIKTSACIAVSMTADCDSDTYVVHSELRNVAEIDEVKWGSDYTVSSFRSCNDLERRAQADILFYGADELEISWNNGKEYSDFPGSRQFLDICTCANFRNPTGTDKILGNAYGNCFLVYEAEDCFGDRAVKFKNKVDFDIGLDKGSIEPCGSITCSRLKVTVLGLEPQFGNSDLVGSVRDMTIATKHTYINNGPVTLEDIYEVTREIEEIAEFKLSDGLRQLASVANGFEMEFANHTENIEERRWDAGVTAEVKANVTIGKPGAGGKDKDKEDDDKKDKEDEDTKDNGDVDDNKMKGNETTGKFKLKNVKTKAELSLQGRYQSKAVQKLEKGLESALKSTTDSTSESDISKSMRHIVTTSRTFTETKTIVVPPCTKYEFTSHLKMAEGAYLDYYVNLAITGEYFGGKKLKAVEIREILSRPGPNPDIPKQITFFDDDESEVDEFTVYGFTRATLKSSYGLESTINGVGEDIPDCLSKNKPLVCT